MIKTFTCLIFSLISITGFSQTFGNEWINFTSGGPLSDQQYYKIKVTSEGIYRISSSTLIAAGIPVGGIPSQKYQIFYQGSEQPIYVSTLPVTAPLGINDFIEFYGKGNDGKLDGKMYKNDSTGFLDLTSQPNSQYSLFTDTAIYYLTWRTNNLNGLPIQQITTNNFTGLTPIAYFLKEVYKQYFDDYNFGTTDPFDNTDPDYMTAEGFCSIRISANNSLPFTFNAPNLFSSGPNSLLNLTEATRSNDINDYPNQHVRITFNSMSPLYDSLFNGFYLKKIINYPIPNSNVNLSNNTISVSSIYLNDPYNPQSVSVYYYSFTYPHTLDFSSEGNPSSYKLIIPDDVSGNSYLKLSNLSSGNYILYDVTNFRRITVIDSSDNFLYALVPNGNGNKTCYLTKSPQSILNITPVNSANGGKFLNFNYSGNKKDSAFIIISHSSLMTEAQNYNTYRSPRHSVLVDIDELYNQFAWGIQKHPLSIRNFIAYCLNKWNSPQYVFIIGKAIHGDAIRFDTSLFAHTLVPSYGFPASDILLGCGINGNGYNPSIPIGRLAAQSPDDVSLYLTKVQQYESNAPAEWMKQVLHFGGGNTGWEQDLFQGYLNNYRDTIQHPWFGGYVTSYFKTSPDPIQINISDSLQSQINHGVSIMTFFGHASGSTGFDNSTNDPSVFQNAPHYPLVIANSCYAGDIHQSTKSISEEFVIDRNTQGNPAGSIGFIGSNTLGLDGPLYNYTSRLYRQIDTLNYGNAIGKCMKATVDSLYNNYQNDYDTKSVSLEMTLHGDPSIVINSPKLPDLVMEPQNIYFTPYPVTSDLSTFKINVICLNVGKAITDTFFVRIKRTYPSGIISDTSIMVPRCYYRDTVSLTLPVDQFNGVGLNTFYVMLDSRDSIHESNENNNSTNASLLISSPDIMPVFPINYAIVPRKDSLILKACTSNPFAALRTYVFQIDTTDAYNSPMLRTTKITQTGGVLNWANPYPYLKDSTVYFWRVSPDEPIDSLFKWREFSFIYIPNKTGWSQAHIFQFKNDTYEDVTYNKPKRRFDFVTNTGALVASTTLNPTGLNPTGYYVNGILGDYNTCGVPALYLAVFDSITLMHWTNADHNLNSINFDPNGGTCNGNHRAQGYFIYDTSQASMTNLAVALTSNNSIPVGDYILIYSVWDVNYQALPSNVKSAIWSLGGHHITNLTHDQSYLFFTQKGHPDSTKEVYGGVGDNSVFNLNATMWGKWVNGFANSTAIGPAAHWSSLHWKEHPVEAEVITKDSVYLRLFGIKNDGTSDILINSIPLSTNNLSLNNINAGTYPYLQLQAYMQDKVLRTPPQLDRWQIYYTGVPDVALNPSKGYSFYKSPMDAGDTLRFSTNIENISPYPMTDSLNVSFYIFDQNRQKHLLTSQKKKRMLPGDTVVASVVFPTTSSFAGLNSFWVEANPANNPVEQYHFNNIGAINFNINKDITNPVLDVTFDGVHILNGDIVSPKPEILIKLTDENKFLALNDTNLFRVMITNPAGVPTQLHFERNSPEPIDHAKMGWTPALLPHNSFKIVYNPLSLQDGTYQLDVQAIDRSGNLSGALDYKISFEVVNHESITEVMNYPNPFSTSTRFVFTLTGSEIPTYFKIQIMTITGRVIREIMLDELGPIHIGRNITQYAWNGKDQYGDQLANGVYFYRIVTKLNGQNIDHLATDGDQWFTHGIGKMYLLR